jgi:polyisoprenoid-binding protein YceI
MTVFAHGPVPVNIEASTIKWTATKVTGEHYGSVQFKEAELDVQNGQLKGGSFTVDMNTIQDLDMEGEWKAKLEGHLRSDDFFSVATYPTASFVTTNVKSLGNGKYSVTGDMTIKGKTHPLTFEANLANNTATATLKIDRTLYDVRYGSTKFFDALGDKAIYDEFTLEVSMSY